MDSPTSSRSPSPSILSHEDETYHIFGFVAATGTGCVLAARNNAGDLVAIKVVHKSLVYPVSYARDNLLEERAIMGKIAESAKPFLVRLLACWSDKANVYFVMVSLAICM